MLRDLSTGGTATTEPRVHRRYATGSESARGLLFTVLGEFVLPSGEDVWTSTFIDVLARLGVEEKAARQALMRTASDGWLVSERIGRRTRWSLTESAERLLSEGAKRIYGFTGAAADWDNRWLVILARVPESDRRARHQLFTRLAWAGFGSPTSGVWVSAHPDRVAEAEAVLEQAGILEEAQVFTAEHTSGDLEKMISQAWDLTILDENYRSFQEQFSNGTSTDPLARLVELVNAWRHFPWNDPTLPYELLPAGWSGLKAVKLFQRRHEQWAARANGEWVRLNADAA